MIRRLAVVVLGSATFCAALADTVLIALPRTSALPELSGLRGTATISAVVLAILGGAIALRQPRNGVGWIFLVCVMFTALFVEAEAGKRATEEVVRDVVASRPASFFFPLNIVIITAIILDMVLKRF